jgi:predicted PurR-regulated permease PerM
VETDKPPPSFIPVVSTVAQRRALGMFALVASAALVWLALPVASGLFLGTLVAFTLLRIHGRLAQRLGHPGLAAVILAVGSGLSIVGTIASLAYFIIARGIVAANQLAHGFEPEGQLRKWLVRLDESSRGSSFGAINATDRLREWAANTASKLTDLAATIAGATLSAVLTLFFIVLTTFFVLRHWTDLVTRAERMLPLHPVHTRIALAEFQKVGKDVFLGTMLTGIIQGILGALGYAIAGVPEVALLGALTAISSLVPIVGTVLVWLPVGIWLIVSDHVTAGLLELIYGALVVGIFCEYGVRPRLVGSKSHAPTLVTFISLFGGVKLFGMLGLVVGPVIASVALALLRTYDREIVRGAIGEPPPLDEPDFPPPAKTGVP